MGITAPTSEFSTYPLNRKEFGIHSVSAYNRSTGLPYGELAIVGDCSISFEASSVDLRGGSSLYPRATEITEIDSNVSCNLRSFPDWVMELWMAGTVTTTDASTTSGTISALTNVIGSTAFEATTGVASVAATSSATLDDLKTNYYRVIAVSATTVDVYTASDFQFTRGTDLYFDSDALKITTSALTISSGTAVEIPGTGLSLTGGSGVIDMTIGDVFEFKVAPPHQGISDVDIGVPGNTFPEHGLWLFGKERGSGEKVSIQCYKAQCVSGLTYNMSMSDFSSTDVTLKLLLDTAKSKIATIRFIAGT